MRRTRSSSLEAGLRAGRLSTWGLFFLGIAAVTPLSVVAGAIPLGYGQVRQLGVPAGYTVVAVVLGLFAVGLAAMANHVPNSGAFYSYVAAGLGKPAGVATAMIALAAYNAMQIGLYGAFGVATSAAMAMLGIDAYWGVWILIGWLAVGVLGQLKVRVNARILGVLICAEVLIVLILDAAMIGHPAGGTVRYETLNPALLASPEGAASLVGGIAGLVGFEIPLAFALLARDPRRTTRRAIYAILAVVALLYAGSAWAMSVVTGPDRIIAVAGEHLSDLFFFLPAPYLPHAVLDVGAALFATSLFAAMLAFHSTVARYTLTLAREGVLPHWLARTRDDEVPVGGSALQTGIAIVSLLVIVALGLDPTTDLFFYGTVSGGLGVLVLMSVTAVAVIRFFHRHPLGENLWRRRIAPIVSAAFLITVLLLTLAFFGELLGTVSPIRTWATPAAYLLVAGAGVAWAFHLKRNRPDAWAVIGHGDRAVPVRRLVSRRAPGDADNQPRHAYINGH
jgi:amino acid transporter